jgi:hypothetical protein
MEGSMKALLALFILAAGAGGYATMSPARAEMVFRYCMTGTPNMGMDCIYNSLQQCQAAASGGIGFCHENPAYTAQARQTTRPVPQR